MDICGGGFCRAAQKFYFLLFILWLFCVLRHYIIIHFNIIHFVLGKVNIYEAFCITKGCSQKWGCLFTAPYTNNHLISNNRIKHCLKIRQILIFKIKSSHFGRFADLTADIFII